MISSLLNLSFLANNLVRWSVALIIALASFFLLRIVRNIMRKRLRKLAKMTETFIDDMLVDLLSHTRSFLFYSVALFAGSKALILPENISQLIGQFTILTLLAQGIIWGNRAISFSMRHYNQEATTASARTTLSAINFIGRLLLYSLIALLALDNLGIDITALVAGLGITSLAVALALQNILGDLFSSLSIVLDKPFEIGDFIVVGDYSGSIEKIGLRSTRVRSLSGEQLVFTNKDLLESRIRNYKRMQERRVSFSLGLSYDTPINTLKEVPTMLKNIIEAQEHTRFDRAHFKSFGEYALNFEIVYYMLEPDYVLFMDKQEAINLGIFHRFAQENIEFAYPSQTIFLQPQPEPKKPSAGS